MPENEDIAETKKLRPGERLKKLKQLEEKRKKEINEIEDLIKVSEKELKTEKVAEDIVPRQREIDIKSLFEEEGNKLEITAKRDAPLKESSGKNQYDSFKQIYTELQSIAYASMTGSLTQEQMGVVDEIGERLDKTKYESASAEVANLLVASRTVLYKIRKYAGVEGRSNY